MATLKLINNAAQQAHEWINEVQEELKLPHEQSAYAALRAVLHNLRDRRPVKESADLSAQLPTLIRGIYFEGWSPNKNKKVARTVEEFTNGVRKELSDHGEIHAQNAIRSVFALLDRKVTDGEINDVIGNFPIEMRKLWPKEAVDRQGMQSGR